MQAMLKMMKGKVQKTKAGAGKKVLMKAGKDKKERECKADCKWCAMGECWNSGQIEKPEKKLASGGSKVQKRNLKQTKTFKAGGQAGGKMAMMQAMLKMMKGKVQKTKAGAGKKVLMKAGKDKKERECKADCKWCAMGECWNSGQIEKP